MSDLSYGELKKNIQEYFREPSRTIVLWEDPKQDFKPFVDELELDDVVVYVLYPNNLFETKIMLENSNDDYLIYIPHSISESEKHHLADVFQYAKHFSADKTSFVVNSLSLPYQSKLILDEHHVFFNSEKRLKHFRNLSFDHEETNDSLRTGMLTVVANLKVNDFQILLRHLLLEDYHRQREFIDEIERYRLSEYFWNRIEKEYGYDEEERSLQRFTLSLFITYATWQIQENSLFEKVEELILPNRGAVLALMDPLKNNYQTLDQFKLLAKKVENHFGGVVYFSQFEKQYLLELDIFESADIILLSWMTDHLVQENVDITLDNKTLLEITNLRSQKYYYRDFSKEYQLIENAIHFFKVNKSLGKIGPRVDKDYVARYYVLDRYYRYIVETFDRIEEKQRYEKLVELIEHRYLSYLNYIVPLFSKNLKGRRDFPKQRSFYNKYLSDETVKTVVIISDALRYEAARDFQERLNEKLRYTTKMDYLLSSLPSYTALGMASLLPHNTLEFTSNYEVLLDGYKVSSLKEREEQLKRYDEESFAIQANDFLKMKRSEARAKFQGKSIIYIYHNQIDARGDSIKTEDEVFRAVNDSFEELSEIVRVLSSSLSISNIYLTADHGFLYTRSQNQEHEKIERFFDNDDYINRRFIISDKRYEVVGVECYSMRDDLNIQSDYYVHVPNSYHVFKVQGGGQNYYHGGLSPQESIIPVLNIKPSRGAISTETVNISLLGQLREIHTLIVKVELYQIDVVKDKVLPATFKLFFSDKEGNMISNEHVYYADSQSEETSDRIHSFAFNLVNKEYSLEEEYYFVARDVDTQLDVIKSPVKIDIVFANDFGF